jgi:hypothetical protein
MKKATASPARHWTRNDHRLNTGDIGKDCVRAVVADITQQLLPVCVEVSFAFRYQR